MSDCPACTNARKHPLSGVFQLNCDDCRARGISRMQPFFLAAREGRMTPEYMRVLADQLPNLTQADAHAMVKGWVRPTLTRTNQ